MDRAVDCQLPSARKYSIFTYLLILVSQKQVFFRSHSPKCRPIWMKIGRDLLFHGTCHDMKHVGCLTLIGEWAAPGQRKTTSFHFSNTLDSRQTTSQTYCSQSLPLHPGPHCGTPVAETISCHGRTGKWRIEHFPLLHCERGTSCRLN